MPTKLKPSASIISDAIIPSIAVNVKLIPIALPSNPSNPPSIAKLANLPIWNKIKVFVSLTLSSDILADSDSTNPPTIARHDDTDAINPIIKLVVGVTLPPKPIFKIPDF